MIVSTSLSKELARLFKERAEAEGKSNYTLTKEAITAYLKKEIEIPKKPDDIPLTGNFEEDVEAMVRSPVPTKEFEKALKELDGNKKLKNAIKRGGAYHEENAILDLQSIIKDGNADFHEIQFHFQYWNTLGILTNVLARRGHKLKPKYVKWMNSLTERRSTKVKDVRGIKAQRARMGR